MKDPNMGFPTINVQFFVSPIVRSLVPELVSLVLGIVFCVSGSVFWVSGSVFWVSGIDLLAFYPRQTYV